MNKVKQTFWGFAVFTVTALGLNSCDSEIVEEQEQETWNTCKLVFDASKESFDDETRTTAYEWKDGEFVYLLFSNGVRPISGKAVYKASSKEWTLEYFGSLSETSSARCKACDIKGNHTSTEEFATLSPNAALYLDTLATYSKSGNIVKVTANLKPQTGRLRFKGKAGSQFNVAGLRFYSSYSFETSETEYEDTTFSCTIGEDGYSPYIYAVMPAKHRLLRVFNSDTIFVTKCADNVLADGKSGYMDVPTESSHYGWETWINMPITIGNSTFKMIYVEGGTFNMGATEEQGTDAQDNEKPVHDVTLSSYYIMETEVTQGLYRDLIGADPSSWKGEKYPCAHFTYSKAKDFVKK